jgi:hypothetical protein
MVPLGGANMERMTPYSPEWQAEANARARAFVVIVSCEVCGHPHVQGRICLTCDDAR